MALTSDDDGDDDDDDAGWCREDPIASCDTLKTESLHRPVSHSDTRRCVIVGFRSFCEGRSGILEDVTNDVK